MKKVLIQNNGQQELVREEIRVSSLFNHPNMLPFLDHSIVSVKVKWFLQQTLTPLLSTSKFIFFFC